jgi:nickel-dependent lactate racemase
VFPAFADHEAQRRFRAPSCALSSVQLQRRRDEAREALWLLGSRFTLQVIPGRGDEILHILAGDIDAVTARGRQLAGAAWNCVVPKRADLVVAVIDGGSQQQTWENVGRSLAAALRIVEDGGSVVVCSDLRTSPGESLMRLAGSRETLDELEREINRDRTPDALTASQLVRALRRVKVYLLSQLDTDMVEGLGLGHVSGPDEILRLSQRHFTCVMLPNSQHAIPKLDEGIATR